MRLFALFILIFFTQLGVTQEEIEQPYALDSLQNLLESTQDKNQQVNLYLEIAAVVAENNLDSAIQISRVGLRIAEKSKNQKNIGDCYYQLADLYKQMGKMAETHETADSAIIAYKKIDSNLDVVKTGLLKVRAYGKYGKFTTSVDLATELIIQLDSLDIKTYRPELLNLIALGHLSLEQNDKAIPFFEQALKEAKEAGNKQVEIWALGNISSYYRHAKRFDEAVEYLRNVIQITLEENNTVEICRAYTNLGATYTRMEEPDSAEYYLLLAYETCKELKNNPSNIKTTWHLAELYKHINKPDLAIKYVTESLEMAERLNMREDVCYAYEILYRATRMKGDYKTASILADSLFICKENMYNANLSEQLSRAITLYDNAVLEKEAIQQKAAIEKLEIKNRNNKRGAWWIGITSILTIFLGLFYFWNKRNKEKLKFEEEYQIELTKKLEEDRKWRAAELHDNVGQQLVLMKQMMDSKANMEESGQMLQEAINKVRSISRDEYPYQLKYLGLKTTLEDLIDRIENSSSLVVSEGLDNIPSIDSKSSLHVFRIIQECFNNTLKYSGAPSVQVELSQDENMLIIQYQDSGNPFDFQNELVTKHSLGLKTIIDRVKILKGKVISVPSKDKGNKYILHIPLYDI